MKKEELKENISRVIDSFVVDIWITPYHCKKYIPSENIWKLKEKLFVLLDSKKKEA